jgi:hypothetical protein
LFFHLEGVGDGQTSSIPSPHNAIVPLQATMNSGQRISRVTLVLFSCAIQAYSSINHSATVYFLKLVTLVRTIQQLVPAAFKSSF